MFTSLTETNPASSEYQNPPSRSSVFNGFSINYDRYPISRILAGEKAILRSSKFEAIEQIISALQKYVSILREIDQVCIMSSAASDTKKSGLDSCYADRDIDTLSNGGKCDRRFANKESDAIANRHLPEFLWNRPESLFKTCFLGDV
ncbi:MAG: hypothetical protein LH628_01685 [Microcoleus sp. CAN_BIN18]|nr:hypothetical protein [Microcoleus sp. CAN_BIN18]